MHLPVVLVVEGHPCGLVIACGDQKAAKGYTVYCVAIVRAETQSSRILLIRCEQPTHDGRIVVPWKSPNPELNAKPGA